MRKRRLITKGERGWGEGHLGAGWGLLYLTEMEGGQTRGWDGGGRGKVGGEGDQ